MKRVIIAVWIVVAACLSAVAQQYTDPVTDRTPDAVDPNFARAELMMTYVLNNQADSLYANMSDQVKGMLEPKQLEGLRTQMESMAGAYQSHEPWEMQEVMGHKAYVSLMTFEKSQLGMLIVFDKAGKMLGINMVPPEAIKKN